MTSSSMTRSDGNQVMMLDVSKDFTLQLLNKDFTLQNKDKSKYFS